MSTLDIKKSIIKYTLFSIICILINYIYNKFGHGVTSNHMKYMFLYPLIGGIIIIIFNKIIYSKLYNCGLFTLTIGSFLNGILVIAGTTSIFIKYYYILGIIFILISFLKIIKKLN